MQSLARGGYTAEQVKAALHGLSGTRTMKFRYELLTAEGVRKGDLQTATGASISNDVEAEIPRTARFTLKEDLSIDYGSDRIKPYAQVQMPDGGWIEFPQGVFLLSSPRRRADIGGVFREIEAYDQCQVLLDDHTDSRYLITAGTNYITAVQTILTSAGVMRTNLVPTSKNLPVDREWDPDTPKLQIINDLLRALNYTRLWFDEDGVAQAAPFVTPDKAPSMYTYADDQRSVIVAPSVEQELDLFAVPNKFTLVVSEPDRIAMRSTYINQNANSPTSTASRGRTISHYRQVEAADQATLDALAQRAAWDASQVYETVSWDSWLMPHHSHGDVYQFTYSRLGLSSRFHEIGWEMELSVQGIMKHRARRIVSV